MAISIAGQMDEFRVDFTVQQEWRLLILIAFFFGSVGSGAFLLSQLLGSVWGMVAGLLIVAIIKGGAHLIYLGRPARFFWAFTHPQTSWISRGLISLAVFMVCGVLYVLPFFQAFKSLPWAPGSTASLILGIIAFMAGLVVMVYTAFVMATPPSIPFWNTALLPILFLLYGVMGGMDVLLVLNALSALPASLPIDLELTELVLLTLALVVITIYVGLMANGSAGAKRAVSLFTKGALAAHFVVGVLVIGLIIPLGIGLYVYFFAPSTLWATVLEAVLVFCGGLMLRWVILRAGVYAPVY